MKTKDSFSGSYLKIAQLSIIVLVILYFGRALFIPISFALLIALILYPFCTWLEKHHWPRSLAIGLLLTLVIALFALVIWLLIWQVNYLNTDIPAVADKIRLLLYQIEEWFNNKIGSLFNLEEDWLENTAASVGNATGANLQVAIKNIGSMVFSLFIIPVFVTLFLYNREQFVDFIRSILPKKYHEQLPSILKRVSFTYSRYIIGLIQIYLIVGVLNSIGLLALGIKHAILFGMLTAFMTMIPYIGITISSLLPMTVAWVTKDSLVYPIAIVAIFAFVQYLENSIIFPKIIGKQLNVSTWAILVALLAGGIIWGVSGMVLFMPFVAILKIISDQVDEWLPLNILISRKGKLNQPPDPKHKEE